MTAEQANRAKLAKLHAQQGDGVVPPPDEQTVDASRYTGDSYSESNTLGTALGLFSIGLGLVELFAPKMLSRMIGIKPTAMTSTTMRAFGLREVGTGLLMLAEPRRAEWAWVRVAGDALDISTLARAAKGRRNHGRRVAAVAVATLGIVALDVARARQLNAPRIRPRPSTTTPEQLAASKPAQLAARVHSESTALSAGT